MHACKEVIELDNQNIVTWLTPDKIELLRRVGLEKAEAFNRALHTRFRVGVAYVLI